MDKVMGTFAMLVVAAAFGSADGLQSARTLLAATSEGDIQAPFQIGDEIQAPYQSGDDIQAPAQGGDIQVPYHRADI